MELDRAKEIIQALADGVDLYGGKCFSNDELHRGAVTVQKVLWMP